MSVRAQLSVMDHRRAARYPVEYPVVAEHHNKGDVQLNVVNISAHGFMVDNNPNLSRGDRIIIRLPIVGRIEAYLIWSRAERAGFQFERIIRVDDFDMMVEALQPNEKLRRRR